MGNVSGEVTKVEGEMVTVKMADGSTKAVHVDPKGTKKEGDIKVGTHVSADVTSSGHANWIKEMKEDQTGTMKK
jgi:ribosomal protein S1